MTAVLTHLRGFALTLRFKGVSDRYERGGDGLRFLASVLAEGFPDDTPRMIGDVDMVQGFSVHPGDGCETAAFAFMRRTDESGSHTEWFWHSSCKTQYASVISDSHLVTCHAGLVKILDEAIRIGVDVVVRDETHYWDTRDEERLIAEVGAMNRIVAAFAGKLSDLSGMPDGHLRSPIFRHPRFERLEMDLDE
ncbi:MAG: hypothetical protein EXR93_02820 [Gemmatimonadetes bacterium]|nr:hypothetical protein [Gemmatimonadota bacterium]